MFTEQVQAIQFDGDNAERIQRELLDPLVAEAHASKLMHLPGFALHLTSGNIAYLQMTPGISERGKELGDRPQFFFSSVPPGCWIVSNGYPLGVRVVPDEEFQKTFHA